MRTKGICLGIFGMIIIGLFINVISAQPEEMSLEDFKENPTVDSFKQLSLEDQASYLNTNYDKKYAREYISKADLTITDENKELVRKVLKDKGATGDKYTDNVLANAKKYLDSIPSITEKEDKEIAEKYCSSLGDIKCSDFKNAASITVEEQDGKPVFHFNNVKKGDKIVFSPDGKTKIEYRSKQEGASFHVYSNADGYVVDAKKEGFFRVDKEKYTVGKDGHVLATFDTESRLKELNGKDWLVEKPTFTSKNKGFFRSKEGSMKISYKDGNAVIDESENIKFGEVSIRDDGSTLSGKGSFKGMEFKDGKIGYYQIAEGMVHYIRRGREYARFKTTKNPISVYDKMDLSPDYLKGIYKKGDSFGFIDKNGYPGLGGPGKVARPGAAFTSERDTIVQLSKKVWDNYFDVAYLKASKGDGPVATAVIEGRQINFEQKGDRLFAKTHSISDEDDFTTSQVSFYNSLESWQKGKDGIRILDEAQGVIYAQAKEVQIFKPAKLSTSDPLGPITTKKADVPLKIEDKAKELASLEKQKEIIKAQREEVIRKNPPSNTGQYQDEIKPFDDQITELDGKIGALEATPTESLTSEAKVQKLNPLNEEIARLNKIRERVLSEAVTSTQLEGELVPLDRSIADLKRQKRLIESAPTIIPSTPIKPISAGETGSKPISTGTENFAKTEAELEAKYGILLPPPIGEKPYEGDTKPTEEKVETLTPITAEEKAQKLAPLNEEIARLYKIRERVLMEAVTETQLEGELVPLDRSIADLESQARVIKTTPVITPSIPEPTPISAEEKSKKLNYLNNEVNILKKNRERVLMEAVTQTQLEGELVPLDRSISDLEKQIGALKKQPVIKETQPSGDSTGIFDATVNLLKMSSPGATAFLNSIGSLVGSSGQPVTPPPEPKNLGETTVFQNRQKEFNLKINDMDSQIASERQRVDYMNKLRDEVLDDASWTPDGELEDSLTEEYDEAITVSEKIIKDYQKRQSELRGNIQELDLLKNSPPGFSHPLLVEKKIEVAINDISDYDSNINKYAPTKINDRLKMTLISEGQESNIDVWNRGDQIIIFDGTKYHRAPNNWDLINKGAFGHAGLRDKMQGMLNKGNVKIIIRE